MLLVRMMMVIYMIIFMLSPGLCAGRNLLPNAGFESGAEGWTLWTQDAETASGAVVYEGAREGDGCFRVDNSGSGGANLFSNPVPASGDTDYTLSAYVKTVGAKDVKVAVWALRADDVILSYELPYGASVPDNQPTWARFKSIIHTPPDCVALKAHLICNGGTVFWDAVQLETGRDTTVFCPGPVPGMQWKNLLSNSGFEEGDAQWQVWHQFHGDSSGKVEHGTGRTGSAALHVTNSGKGGANLHSDPQVCKPDTTYTLSVYAHIENGEGIALAAWGEDGSGKTLSYAIDGSVQLPQKTEGYTRFTKTFTTGPDCVAVKAHLICNGGDVWWDDCQIEAGEIASEYEAGPGIGALPVRAGPERIAYTRAIIHEARLNDVLAQTERLVRYVRQDTLKLQPAREAVAECSEILGSACLVPDYEAVDYAQFDEQMLQAKKALSEIWQSLGYDPGGLFDDWRPKLEGDLSKARLVNEFFIFPCFTRDWMLTDGKPWELLEPFGFRIVSGWGGLGYSRDGKLITGMMDDVIRKCHSQGYLYDMALDGATGAATLSDSLGEWCYLHTADGKWSPAGDCHSTTNIWQPQVRQAAADFLTKAAIYGARNPGVIAYELQNEPSLTVEEATHGYVFTPLGIGGYGPDAARAWTEWLQLKYQSVDNLNRNWRTAYGEFDEISSPAGIIPPNPVDEQTPMRLGALHDFMTFRSDSHARWLRLCVEAIHAGDLAKPVISQFYADTVDRKEAAVDLRSMAEDIPWDILGTHDWPGGEPATISLYAVSMNRKAQHPHWEDEFIWSQWERKGTPEPVMRAALERNLWRQIAWGKRGISLFNYESEWTHDLPWNWNNSMLNIEADLEIPRYSTGVIPTVERKANLIKDTLYQTSIVAADIAILRPTAATLVTAPDHRTRQECTRLSELLLTAHYLPFMIPEEHVISGWEDLGSFRVLILPWAVNIPDALQDKLLAWVKQGGIILATGPAGLFNEYGTPSGVLLHEALGECQWRYDDMKETWFCGEINQEVLRGKLGDGEVVVVTDAVTVSARTDEFMAIVRSYIPIPPVHTQMPNVEMILREDGTGRQYLFILNLDATQAQTGEVILQGRPERMVDLTCEAHPEITGTQKEDCTAISIWLHPGGALFLSLGHINVSQSEN